MELSGWGCQSQAWRSLWAPKSLSNICFAIASTTFCFSNSCRMNSCCVQNPSWVPEPLWSWAGASGWSSAVPLLTQNLTGDLCSARLCSCRRATRSQHGPARGISQHLSPHPQKSFLWSGWFPLQVGWSQKGAHSMKSSFQERNVWAHASQGSSSSCWDRFCACLCLSPSTCPCLSLPIVCCHRNAQSVVRGSTLRAQLPGWQGSALPGVQAALELHPFSTRSAAVQAPRVHRQKTENRTKKDAFQTTSTAKTIRACYNALASWIKKV